MTDLLQLLSAATVQAAVYAVLAVGVVLVFSVSGILNLAQGELAVSGALVAWAAWTGGLSLPAALLLGVAASGSIGWAVDRGIVRKVPRLTPLQSIVLTLGVATALRGAMLVVWGPRTHALPAWLDTRWRWGGVTIGAYEAVLVVVAIGVLGAVWLAVERTRMGAGFRACAEQSMAAQLVGISSVQMRMAAFVAAGVLAAVAGILASPLYLTAWDSGLVLGLKAFVAAAIGGMHSVSGAVGGAILLATSETLVAGYIDTGLRDAVAFLLLIVLLSWRRIPGYRLERV